MFKRTFWFGTGVTAGSAAPCGSGARCCDRAPLHARAGAGRRHHVGAPAGHRRAARRAEGRHAMADREAELRWTAARRGGATREARRPPVGAEPRPGNTHVTTRLTAHLWRRGPLPSYAAPGPISSWPGSTRACPRAASSRRTPAPHVHQLGHDAVRPLLPGRGARAVPAAGGVGAALRARRRQAQRPRRHRALAAPPQLLRDAGQLQLRRLLQGRRHHLGVGVRHRGARARRRPPVGDGPRERRRGRGAVGRRGGLPPRAHPADGQGQLLGDGRHGPVRPLVRDLLGQRARGRPRGRPGQPRRPRTATSRSGTWCSRSTCGRRRPAERPALQEHRHGRRARAHHGGAGRQPQPLRVRHALRAGRRGAVGHRAPPGRVRPGRHRAAAHGRPRPHHDVPGGRRGHPLQRGPRLRAAPHHPPGHPLRLPARRRAAGAAGHGRAHDRADGRRLPRGSSTAATWCCRSSPARRSRSGARWPPARRSSTPSSTGSSRGAPCRARWRSSSTTPTGSPSR